MLWSLLLDLHYVWVLHKYFVMRDGDMSQCDIFNVQLLVHCVSEMLLCNKISLTIHPVNNAVFPADFLKKMLQVLRHHVMECLC